MKKSLRIIASGRVQGVGFRYHVKQAALSTGICGYVKNLPDGTVLIEAEGDNLNLDTFINICKQGNGYARVLSLTQQSQSLKGYEEFGIL